MPTVLKIFGLRFFYWSQEHKPIHIHVKKGNGEAKFVIEPEVELVENHRMKPHELALAEEIIKDNREFMIEHWKLYFKKGQQK
jgi:hypothetical protein